VLPVVAPQPIREVGERIGALFTAAGLHSPLGAELWNAYSWMTDRTTRSASLRTLRSVVDHRGSAAVAMTPPHLAAHLPVQLIWGERDWVVPVAHGHAAHQAMPGSRLTVVADAGHFPHVEAPAAVDGIIRDFIATTQRRSALITRC
jgi:pimeloyl-ACP methyl ester carboxylesterase